VPSRIVAIDGPSASGKSTTSLAVARRLGFDHLDSGALYRGLTLVALEAGLPRPFDGQAILSVAGETGLELRADDGRYEVMAGGEAVGGRLRDADVTAHVSEVAALPEVRSWVNDRVRKAVRDRSVVVDGRDIGSVVFPEARVKIFLTATPAARARRRLLQQGEAVPEDVVDRETERLARRDQADSTRALAPLRQAPDAVLVDGSALSFEDQVERILEIAREAYGIGRVG